jgi:hypothetical protein
MNNSTMNLSIGFDLAGGGDISVRQIVYRKADGIRFMTYGEYFELMGKIRGCLCVEDERKVECEKGISEA